MLFTYEYFKDIVYHLFCFQSASLEPDQVNNLFTIRVDKSYIGWDIFLILILFYKLRFFYDKGLYIP
jgi:hypothetical protein